MAISSSVRRGCFALLVSVVLVLACWAPAAAGDNSEFEDSTSPKFPGCDNPFQKVKVMYWVDGDEMISLTGITARFGKMLPVTASDSQKRKAVVPSPESSCAKSSAQLANSVAVAKRGGCPFLDKAKTAESGGAAALLLINYDNDLHKMVCTQNDSALTSPSRS
ncbi:hypothetical protein GUJ93_ZPchr0001g32625 [Zizania palustris]|uniref:PA domain-containing protein n=1 Tax=Zizania palustris TaxID=103762 RepID=A0A8J5RYM7_ZIZPA|nr:hypothetical protein GUJ93_ZPchr0001g32625 [Zizania palustris]